MKKSLFLIVIFLVTSSITYADFVVEQAQNTVNAFNSLNDGKGYVYQVSPDKGRYNLTSAQGYEQANLGAYSSMTGGENFIKTFCVEPIVGTAPKQIGKLNYENNSSQTTSGHKLTLGSAYLYASFATGDLNGYNYLSPNYTNGKELSNAIQFLMGSIYDINWYANDFLVGLLGIKDDQSYWEQVYDPGQYYDEIGDYSVFVMNNQDEYGTHRQDFLYLAEHESGAAVTPEPASFLIFGAGLAGLALAGRLRKKRIHAPVQ